MSWHETFGKKAKKKKMLITEGQTRHVVLR